MELTLLEQILGAIADAEQKEPEDLKIVLQDYIDTDAIEWLAAHDSDSWVLQFEIPNHSVTIKAGEAVFIDGVKERTLT